jgi:hypothetical protein
MNPLFFYFSSVLHQLHICSFLKYKTFFFEIKQFAKQEGHDGPGVAHLYIGPQGGASLNQRAFI